MGQPLPLLRNSLLSLSLSFSLSLFLSFFLSLYVFLLSLSLSSVCVCVYISISLSLPLNTARNRFSKIAITLKFHWYFTIIRTPTLIHQNQFKINSGNSGNQHKKIIVSVSHGHYLQSLSHAPFSLSLSLSPSHCRTTHT